MMSDNWRIVSVMVAINMAFAVVNLLLKKTLDHGVNHLVIVTYRQVVSTLFLAPIALLWERKGRTEITARIVCHLFVSALIGVTLTQFLFLTGLEYTSATFACAFLNMVPVFTFILALPFRLERLSLESKGARAKVLGAVTCVVGALVLTFYRGAQVTTWHIKGAAGEALPAALNSSGEVKKWAAGSALLAAGCLMWSSWFLMQASIGKAFPFQYSSTAILSFFGALQSAVLSVAVGRRREVFSMWVLKEKLDIMTVVYAGTVGSALCYAGMSWCVKKKGPVFTSAFTPLTQIFVAIIDTTVFHEQLYLGSLVGSVLVISGMYGLLWGKSKEAKEYAAKLGPVEAGDGEVMPITVNSIKS